MQGADNRNIGPVFSLHLLRYQSQYPDHDLRAYKYIGGIDGTKQKKIPNDTDPNAVFAH